MKRRSRNSQQVSDLKKELGKAADKKKAKDLQRFFKTGKGEYGEGDIFLGVTVPEQRKIAKKYKLNLQEIQGLMDTNVHEYRLSALFMLIEMYKDTDDITEFYLKNTKNINNWDLVDLSAPKILGDYLLDKDRDILYRLAKSDNLWERRIAIIATAAFIRNHEFDDTLRISKILLGDRHDLIHKAVGWMLREIGKKDRPLLERFLKKNYKKMPRTMLRYAIERLADRKMYLEGKI